MALVNQYGRPFDLRTDAIPYAATRPSTPLSNEQAWRWMHVAHGVIEAIVDLTIGDGLEPLLDDDGMMQQWEAWEVSCGVYGEPWGELLRMVVRELCLDPFGRVLVVQYQDGDGPRLGVIPGCFIRSALGASLRMVDGVEYDERRRPVAYHVTVMASGLTRSVRIPAENAVLLVNYGLAGQCGPRGVSVLDPVLGLASHVSQYVGSEARTSYVQSIIAGVIKTGTGTAPNLRIPDDTAEVNRDSRAPLRTQAEADAIHARLMGNPGGAIIPMKMGEEFDWMRSGHPSTQYQAFIESTWDEVAAAVRIPASFLRGKNRANYSASRAELLLAQAQGSKWRKKLKTLLHALPLWLWGERGRGVKFSEPSMPHIDPWRSARALSQQLETGTTSYDRACRELHGVGIETVLEERRRERDLAQSMGLELSPSLLTSPSSPPSSSGRGANTPP